MTARVRGDALDPKEFAAGQGEWDVHQERGHSQRRQHLRAARDEEQREGDREGDRSRHPRAEVDDGPAELPARLVRERLAQHPMDDATADEREDTGRTRDGDQGEPGGRDDMPGRAAALDPAVGERHARDERERRGRDGDERRREQERVEEARLRADAQPAGEAERDDEQPLDRERQRRPLQEEPQALADLQPACAESPEPAAREQRHERHAEADDAVHHRRPRQGHDPVLVSEQHEEEQRHSSSSRVADRGDHVIVHRRERARRERGEQLQQGCGDEPAECGRRRPLRLRGGRQQPRDPVRPQPSREQDRHSDDGERGREARHLRPEPALTRAPGQVRQRDDAKRRRGQHEHEVQAVRRAETVGLRVTPERAREHDAREARSDRRDRQ